MDIVIPIMADSASWEWTGAVCEQLFLLLLFCQFLFDDLAEGLELFGVVEAGHEDDGTGAVDDDVAGNASALGGKGVEGFAFGVEGEGVGDFGVTGELCRGGSILFQVDAEEGELRVVFVFLPDVPLDEGHLLSADATPAGGELEHHHLAAEVGQFLAGAVGVKDGDVGGFVSHLDDVAAVIPGRNQGEEGGNEKQQFHVHIGFKVSHNGE